MQADPRFLPLLERFELTDLDSQTGTVYGLWPDLTLALTNAAWGRFALANGADERFLARYPLGSPICEAIAGPFREYYRRRFERVLATGEPWSHGYECSSPELFRRLHMWVYPLRGGEGLLAVHSERIVLPRMDSTDVGAAPDPLFYQDANQLLTQCGNCRRFRRIDDPHRWDWLSDWVRASPRNTSHGICPTCRDYYYQEIAEFS